MEEQWVVAHNIVCILLPLPLLLEAFLTWLQQGGQGCGT
jgi:hypothetical protein